MSKKTKVFIIIAGFVFILCCQIYKEIEKDESNLENADNTFSFLEGTVKPLETYYEILSGDIIPGIKPDHEFPVAYQYKNGCFAFAVNSILEHKYGEKIDLLEAENKVGKPRNKLWEPNHMNKFLDVYKLEIKYFYAVENLFSFLEKGEPLIIQYEHEIFKNKIVGHIVAAYSFDKEGIYVSDSLSGKRTRLEYRKFLDSNGRYTKYPFGVLKKKDIKWILKE